MAEPRYFITLSYNCNDSLENGSLFLADLVERMVKYVTPICSDFLRHDLSLVSALLPQHLIWPRSSAMLYQPKYPGLMSPDRFREISWQGPEARHCTMTYRNDGECDSDTRSYFLNGSNSLLPLPYMVTLLYFVNGAVLLEAPAEYINP